ncbi:MAG: terpene cyclase/mutase family protein [Fuerstiella sp.]|nr:terpene cyclase/mutase family protein [Fuerstiella sp.]
MIRFVVSLATTTVLFTTGLIASGQTVDELRRPAVAFLKARQNNDGSWTHPTSLGVTGLVTRALLGSGLAVDDPVIMTALQQLESNVRPTGGIHASDSLHRNYETCIALMAFSTANTGGRYDVVIDRAQRFLAGLQWDEGEGVESSDPAWGGAGYGKHQRPDLCNSEFLVEALKTAGLKDYDPEMKRVIQFISRCQNLESEHNSTEFGPLINDGGFYYTPAAGGDSKSGTEANGGLRSYGSMTYAGVKSLIYAGLQPDDPRILAATEWIGRHYTLDQNPGMGDQGLYYYFHTFAKTMSAFGNDEFIDAEGRKHDWRTELTERLSDLQNPNGSWINPRAQRWEEGDPHLVTAYCLLALSHCESSLSIESADSRKSTSE